MHLKILDVVVEIIRQYSGGSASTAFLADRDGVLLKTADGYYLTVSE